MDKLLLIDGNSLINRAFYGQGSSSRLSSASGVPTGALHTFMMMYLRYLKILESTHVCVAFDTPEKTFRHDHFEEYKGKRSAMPEELAQQIPLLKELLDALGIKRIELAGYEADDIIGTLAERGEKDGKEVQILTGDKDSFQLISKYIKVVMPPFKAGQGDFTLYDREQFFERYGVWPEQFVDVKALMGDSSDNIPGVPGVGEKTALKLIAEYGSLDALYEHTDELKGKQKEKIEENRELAYLSQKLSRIDLDVPLSAAESNFENYRLGSAADPASARTFLEGLGLRQLLQRLELTEAPQPQTDEVKVLDVVAQRVDFPALLSKLQPIQTAARLYLAFSPTMQAYKALKEAAPLLTQGAWLGLSIEEGDKIRSYLAPCPETAEERGALGQALADTACELVCFRSRVLWRERLLHASQSAFDLETVAYLALEKTELKNFSDFYAAFFAEAFATEGLDEAALADRQLQALRRAYPLGIKALGEGRLRDLAEQIDLPLARTLGEMEARGFLVNPSVLASLHKRFAENVAALEQAIYLSAGHEFNINSPKQLGTVLFEELALPSGKKRQNEQYATDLNELQRLKNKHPIIPLIMEYRQQSKLDSTFVVGLKKFIAPEDGRIHSSFNQNLTNTGRLSSRDPNLQNIPVRQQDGKEIRRAFEAKPGYLLLDADYSQIELRLLAHLADEPAMIEAFTADKDIHSRTAAHLFSVTEKEVRPSQRAAAKTVNFSIIYGISAFGLSQDLEISVGEAKRYIDEYHEQYPGVKIFMDKQIAQAKEQGFVETLFGRRRYIEELKSRNYNIRQFGERAAMNTPVQGTAADIIRLAMVRAETAFDEAGLDAKLVSQVHDELIVEVRADQAEAAAELLQKAMEGAAELKVPLKAEVAIAPNWFEAK